MRPIKKLSSKLNQIAQRDLGVEIPAFLGDLNGLVKADDNNNVYVVLLNGQVETVKNSVVSNIPRMPVVIGYKPKSSVLEVLRLRDVYDNPPYVDVPNHAEKTHGEYDVDPARVTNGQILPGLAFPIAGTLTVQFFGMVYYLDGWHILTDKVLDFTDEIPLTAGAHFVLAEVDSAGVISFRSGDTVAAVEMLTYEDIPILSVTKAALFAVAVYYGQTEIRKTKSYTDIFDLRFAGAATGGIASVVDWVDVINAPDTYPPTQATWDAINAIGEGHTHGTFRWSAAGGTTFDLPDFASELIAAYDNALRVDPTQIDLSSDRTQIVFSTAPTAGHAITADYILARL